MNTATHEPHEPIEAPPGAPDFLVHAEGDDVGVAVHDVAPGTRSLVFMDSDRRDEIEVIEAVPLGHKVALANLAGEAPVTEYAVVVALSRGPIAKGSLVHVHNIRSARWKASE